MVVQAAGCLVAPEAVLVYIIPTPAWLIQRTGPTGNKALPWQELRSASATITTSLLQRLVGCARPKGQRAV